jgi:hypothetical protein
MLQPETPFGAQPKRGDARCGVCGHEEHGDTACPKPYCLCDGDAP